MKKVLNTVSITVNAWGKCVSFLARHKRGWNAVIFILNLCVIYSDSGNKSCACIPGYGGPYCEYEVDELQTDACDLECQNGGTCIVDSTHSIDTSVHSQFESYDNSTVHQRCDCPEGYGGPLCEMEALPCGDMECYHGGTCVQRIVDDTLLYNCNCSSSSNNELSYAGLYCEYPATSYCTKNVGLNGHLFCVNNGTCRSDPYTGCDCPQGYTGFSCEFHETSDTEAKGRNFGDNSNGNNEVNALTNNDNDGNVQSTPSMEGITDMSGESFLHNNTNGQQSNQSMEGITEMSSETFSRNNTNAYQDDTVLNFQTVSPTKQPEGGVYACSLKCQNGGTCRYGVKSLGVASDLASTTPYLNSTYSNEFEHCVCRDGFLGLYCEHEVQVCGDGKLICLHGGECVLNGEVHSCDCQNAYINGSTASGSSCQHSATEICTEKGRAPGHALSFCVNGGSCLKIVSQGEP
jgi:hypothetical protein